MKKFKNYKGQHGKWVQINNGEIVFTYLEAKDLRFNKTTFVRALDRLIECGFIDIEYSAAGLFKDKSKYSISERWRKYGTSDFEVKKRLKNKSYIGFRGSKGRGNKKT